MASANERLASSRLSLVALLADGIDPEAVVAGLFLTHADNRIDEIAAGGEGGGVMHRSKPAAKTTSIGIIIGAMPRLEI